MTRMVRAARGTLGGEAQAGRENGNKAPGPEGTVFTQAHYSQDGTVSKYPGNLWFGGKWQGWGAAHHSSHRVFRCSEI